MSEHAIARQQRKSVPTLTAKDGGVLQRARRQHSGGECESCNQKRLQRQPACEAEATGVPPIVHEVLRSPGQPLDLVTREFMEPRFGHDFSQVCMHTDAKAAESAQAVNALAYSVGRDVVFAGGQFAPDTHAGQRLLAHELAHVVQQHSDVPPPIGVRPVQDGFERIADRIADQVAAGAPKSAPLPALSPWRGRIGVPGAQIELPSCSVREIARQNAYTVQRQLGPASPGTLRKAEANWAIKQMYGVVNDINEIGAELEFIFWTSGGAMTLVSWKRTNRGIGAGQSVDESPFTAVFGTWLPTFVGTTDRYFRIVLRREKSAWSVTQTGETKPTGQPSLPPEGRSAPLPTAGYPVDVCIRAYNFVKQIVPLLKVPRNGATEFNFSVDFDDDRALNLNIGSMESKGGTPGGVQLPPQPLFGDVPLLNAVLSFTTGLGRRTVKFKLRGTHSGGATSASWHVAEAGTQRPAAPAQPDEAEAIVKQYRQMHQEIIQKWRTKVKEAAIYAGMMGAEQLALWWIGGAIFKVLGAGLRLVAPRLLGFIGAGTRAGLEYLETMIVRLSSAEKAEMRALVKKAETEGIEALSAAERTQLQALASKLETLIGKALSDPEKAAIRKAMVPRYEAAQAASAQAFKQAGIDYQIHHRIPLEWSHLFPGLDVNAGKNLIGLETTGPHRAVNSVWTRLRTAPATKVKGEHVVRVAEIVDKYFGKWYHKVPSAQGAALGAEAEAAKNAALTEVDQLVKAIASAP